MPCLTEATPTPLLLNGPARDFHFSLSFQKGCSPTSIRHSERPTDFVRDTPKEFFSPFLTPFWSRISKGDKPNFTATMSIICSTAAVTWGTPKPRKAPPIGLFV